MPSTSSSRMKLQSPPEYHRVLSSVHFIVTVWNSLPVHLQGIATVLFVDDTTLSVSAHSILRRRRDASASAMCQDLRWPTLASRRSVSDAMAMHLSVSGHGPS